jgi:hypothetical protein
LLPTAAASGWVTAEMAFQIYWIHYFTLHGVVCLLNRLLLKLISLCPMQQKLVFLWIAYKKVKLCLSTPWRYVPVSWVEVYHHPSWCPCLMKVSGNHHTLVALPPANDPSTHWTGRLGGPQNLPGCLITEKEPLPLLEFEVSTIQPVASHYTDYAILVPILST